MCGGFQVDKNFLINRSSMWSLIVLSHQTWIDPISFYKSRKNEIEGEITENPNPMLHLISYSAFRVDWLTCFFALLPRNLQIGGDFGVELKCAWESSLLALIPENLFIPIPPKSEIDSNSRRVCYCVTPPSARSFIKSGKVNFLTFHAYTNLSDFLLENKKGSLSLPPREENDMGFFG